MIDVSEVILDPDLAQAFTVYREPGVFLAGRWVKGTEQTLTHYGVVTVASVRDIDMVPEGDRVKGMMCFYGTEELFVTRETGTSDQVEWRHERYRILQVLPMGDYGYWKGIGARMSGA